VCCACQKPLEARLQAGDSAANSARWEAARDAFSEATRIDPNAAQAHARLGVSLWQLGEHAAAAMEWEKAEKLDPASMQAIEGLSRFALEQGDAGAAAARLEAVAAPQGSLRLALAQALLARGGPNDATAALTHAQGVLVATPDDVEAMYLLGSAQIALRRFGDAQATLEALQRAHPTVSLGSYGLARLAAAQNRPTDTLLHLSAARTAAGSGWNGARVAADPAFAFLAATPEFKALVGK
jgi:Flp pilus assembly protein TadD